MAKELRELFMKEFVRTLIINYPLPEEERIYPKVMQKHEETVSIMTPQSTKTGTGNALQEIKNLMRDRSILSIECPGADKELIIDKAGMVQPIGLKLSKEEINKVLNEFSKKTRIPLIKGVFKAILGNVILTAIISEHIGTRFIIHKR